MGIFSTTTAASASTLSKPSSLTSRHFVLPDVQRLSYSNSPFRSGMLCLFVLRRPNSFGVECTCDNHWIVVMEEPGGEEATKQQMIEVYVQTLAKILGSEEEAKKRIYNVSCECYYGFGCEVDEQTSVELEEMEGVAFVLLDEYVDPLYENYGAELFVNGEIVARSLEEKRRLDIIWRNYFYHF